MIEILEELALILKNDLEIALVDEDRGGGALQKSIDVVVREKIGGMEIVGQMLYYGKFVDQGRRPGAKGVPIDALISFIRRRKISIPGQKERQTAFMIQRSIKKKGIKPTHFITKTISDNEKNIEQYITEALGSLVDVRLDHIFTDLTD